ncbi:hypothetical protein BU26DRAFT_518745 [Trematosphaeria pertusa]|uniref:Uncharacterized protein n=1 Tax=Trematosphaeria pertusa TaxID=390896 RepID=A0A6A6IJF3_9PLEO|nr:uncharacterized protein BU26DRAFT_518745 [Trematosphaeria pertusa]KAF2250349.1 hypothetical protein BU26DRAFT_518745 [Trematosphaeria pertusa]
MQDQTPASALSRLDMESPPPSSPLEDVKPRVKREPNSESRAIMIDDDDGPTNDLSGAQYEEMDEDELMAQAAVVEVEHKRAMLQLQLAQRKKNKGKGAPRQSM